LGIVSKERGQAMDVMPTPRLDELVGRSLWSKSLVS
jgi:hypothetical protein